MIKIQNIEEKLKNLSIFFVPKFILTAPELEINKSLREITNFSKAFLTEVAEKNDCLIQKVTIDDIFCLVRKNNKELPNSNIDDEIRRYLFDTSKESETKEFWRAKSFLYQNFNKI